MEDQNKKGLSTRPIQKMVQGGLNIVSKKPDEGDLLMDGILDGEDDLAINRYNAKSAPPDLYLQQKGSISQEENSYLYTKEYRDFYKQQNNPRLQKPMNRQNPIEHEDLILLQQQLNSLNISLPEEIYQQTQHPSDLHDLQQRIASPPLYQSIAPVFLQSQTNQIPSQGSGSPDQIIMRNEDINQQQQHQPQNMNQQPAIFKQNLQYGSQLKSQQFNQTNGMHQQGMRKNKQNYFQQNGQNGKDQQQMQGYMLSPFHDSFGQPSNLMVPNQHFQNYIPIENYPYNLNMMYQQQYGQMGGMNYPAQNGYQNGFTNNDNNSFQINDNRLNNNRNNQNRVSNQFHPQNKNTHHNFQNNNPINNGRFPAQKKKYQPINSNMNNYPQQNQYPVAMNNPNNNRKSSMLNDSNNNNSNSNVKNNISTNGTNNNSTNANNNNNVNVNNSNFKALFSDLIESCKDQNSSRIIQKQFENSSIEDKNSIFDRILPEALNLMRDQFGNYVIQKLLEKGTIEHKEKLYQIIKGNVEQLSLHTYGCRVIQKALEELKERPQMQEALIQELNNRIMACIQDQNGNHVIQKCFETLDTSKLTEIIQEVIQNIEELAFHPYGCRVIQRILEFCNSLEVLFQNQFVLKSIPLDSFSQKTKKIYEKLMSNLIYLCECQYGNYIIQYIIEKGDTFEKDQILSVVRQNFVELSLNKFASNVTEKSVIHSNEDFKAGVLDVLFHSETATNLDSGIIKLTKNPFGNYVVQKLYERAETPTKLRMCEFLLQNMDVYNEIISNSFGKHVLSHIEKNRVDFPGFQNQSNLTHSHMTRQNNQNNTSGNHNQHPNYNHYNNQMTLKRFHSQY